MAQSAVPVTPSPRTLTVRVRTLLAAVAVVLAAALVWWALGYATGLQPLSPALHDARVFHNTQAVPLGDMKPVMTVRRSSC